MNGKIQAFLVAVDLFTSEIFCYTSLYCEFTDLQEKKRELENEVKELKLRDKIDD